MQISSKTRNKKIFQYKFCCYRLISYSNLKISDLFALILRLEIVYKEPLVSPHFYESLFFISRDYRTTRIKPQTKVSPSEYWWIRMPNILGFNFIYTKKTSVGFIGLFNMYVGSYLYVLSMYAWWYECERLYLIP